MSLPLLISIIFILTTGLGVFLFLKAAHYSAMVFMILGVLLLLQGVLAYFGFYQSFEAMPPRLFFAFVPTLLLILFLFLTRKGKMWIEDLDLKTLTLIHIVRIPVEIVLYLLYLEKFVPELMTFAGRNFDILAGITAPLVYYFGFIRNTMGRKIILIWNIVCLLLLLNIVVNAILSAPLSFQKFAFGQPNIALQYFPMVWLPAVVVPIVLLSHLVAIKRV